MRNEYLAAFIVFLILSVVQTSFSAPVENYDELMQKALSLRKEGRFEEAEKIYSHIIIGNPDDADALVGRGFCLLRHKAFYDMAENDFQTVIHKAPSYIDAYYGLALIYKRSGKWNEAKDILEKARENSKEKEKSLNYLADISWRIGHLPLARSIDKEPPSERTRELKGFLNELYLTYTYDWVEDRSDWRQAGLAYVHHFRPDMNAGLSFAKYRRNEMDDHQIGLSFSYRYNMNLSFEYVGYFSTDQNFLANQKHQPILYYSLPSYTLIGVGVRLDEYKSGWAEVGRFDFKQFIRSFYGEYTLLTGQDNFDRPVTTYIVKAGYEKENILFCHVGYSNGDETIDLDGGSSFSDQLIESVFFNIRYYVNAKWGVILAGGPEYRDGDLYRTTGAITLFLRF
jgi:hypothetical protein